MTIALDADGVLFDYVGAAAEWANRQPEGRDSLIWCKPENANDWDILKAWGIKHIQDRLDRYCSEPGFVSSLKLYPGAAAFALELMQNHDVIVATSCPTSWHTERESALMELGFAKKDIQFISRKELLDCSALIDDCAANFDGFSGFRCLVDRPWNKKATNCARFYDYDSILHALRFLR